MKIKLEKIHAISFLKDFGEWLDDDIQALSELPFEPGDCYYEEVENHLRDEIDDNLTDEDMLDTFVEKGGQIPASSKEWYDFSLEGAIDCQIDSLVEQHVHDNFNEVALDWFYKEWDEAVCALSGSHVFTEVTMSLDDFLIFNFNLLKKYWPKFSMIRISDYTIRMLIYLAKDQFFQNEGNFSFGQKDN
jgi:hypothetical protein